MVYPDSIIHHPTKPKNSIKNSQELVTVDCLRKIGYYKIRKLDYNLILPNFKTSEFVKCFVLHSFVIKLVSEKNRQTLSKEK